MDPLISKPFRDLISGEDGIESYARIRKNIEAKAEAVDATAWDREKKSKWHRNLQNWLDYSGRALLVLKEPSARHAGKRYRVNKILAETLKGVVDKSNAENEPISKKVVLCAMRRLSEDPEKKLPRDYALRNFCMQLFSIEEQVNLDYRENIDKFLGVAEFAVPKDCAAEYLRVILFAIHQRSKLTDIYMFIDEEGLPGDDEDVKKLFKTLRRLVDAHDFFKVLFIGTRADLVVDGFGSREIVNVKDEIVDERTGSWNFWWNSQFGSSRPITT